MNAPTPASFRRHYQALVAAGTIEADPAQAQAVEAYSGLEARLARYRPGRGGLLQRLFADKDATAPRGLYIYGEVGRGKTMLMDLFFNDSPVLTSAAPISTNSWPMCMSGFTAFARRSRGRRLPIPIL
jgi:cell division protein ZapE